MKFFEKLKKLTGRDVVKGVKKAAPFLPFGSQIQQAIEEAEKAYERSKPKQKEKTMAAIEKPTVPVKEKNLIPLIGLGGLLLLLSKK